ncbi:MAG: hypothetical protein LBS26_01425 [Campylobacteraceae bacterium]|nr:hypothetical protein [Campylobacteraceae bacterium]
MEIAFRKIAKEALDFELVKERVKFFGKVFRKSSDLVLLKADLIGEISHVCDRCGEDLKLEINEPLEILLSNGVYNGEIDEIDVVEFYDGYIYFDEILQSEIESIKSGYHYCNKCKN